MSALPAGLKAALDDLCAGHAGRDLAEAQARLSADYRAGRSARMMHPVDCAAYAVARLPATYAASLKSLAMARAHCDLAPRSLLDVGAGSGAAAHAAVVTYPSLATATLVDAHEGMLATAKALAASAPPLARARFLRADLTRLGGVEPADLVTASYALNEVEADRTDEAALRLFGLALGLLVIVEPGTPRGFAVIARARAALIAAGATVVAPCPHGSSCPVVTPDWCHFSVRLPRLRAHKAAKRAEAPFEDEPFSCLVVAKAGVSVNAAAARILRAPIRLKPETRYRLCATGGAADRIVPARDRAAAKIARRLEWGDAWPADLAP